MYLRRDSLLKRLPIHPTDTVLLGDSITHEGEWAELLGAIAVKNRGISGDTTGGLLSRLAPILDAAPQTILLMIGINDLLNQQNSPAEISQNYHKILAHIQAQAPQTRVLVQSVLPVNAQLCGRQVSQEIMVVNAQLQALSKEFSYEYIDLFQQFTDPQNQLDQQYTLDGVHLNGAGYLRWQQILEPYL
ncbi:MAG: G-D-S-L family lipolytic protein [Leptolyngbyaceae cyanobacterium CRU_2_3]|nr:G-D-S-L family lipolytic protein [Leptolyngbyaceae cyanobacterium CRU_2_3]